MLNASAIFQTPVTKVRGNTIASLSDALAVEEPLEIRLAYGSMDDRVVKNVSVTMRTPGNDEELATGFLFTEGIISGKNDLETVSHRFIACAADKQNVIQVELGAGVLPTLKHMERNFYTTSSCGVCGKGSIASIKTVSRFNADELADISITPEQLLALPRLLREHQDVFEATGALHGCALFNTNGKLLILREDVGRHNALDKLIGAALEAGLLPLDKQVLLLSGRASFELVQKAAMAGIRIVAAVGAPSSLAVELAGEFGITLIGFLRDQRFNIYTMEHRILINTYEN
jgi:FdhD protein